MILTVGRDLDRTTARPAWDLRRPDVACAFDA
jgi:hypothetical protein